MTVAPSAPTMEGYRTQVLACAAEAPHAATAARLHVEDASRRVRTARNAWGDGSEPHAVACRQLVGALKALRDLTRT